MPLLQIPVKAKYTFDGDVMIDAEYEYMSVEEDVFADVMGNMIAAAFGVRKNKDLILHPNAGENRNDEQEKHKS